VALTNDSPLPATPLRVLIVDDYPDSADAASLLLMLYGHECRTATTGQGALEQAEMFDPDVVILDIGLPDITGYEVARTLRARARSRPLYIAAVTGSGLPEDRAKAFAAGFDYHITKPADLKKLSLIVKLADQHSTERQLIR
jgi:CheY-like chemotaxis protein